MAIRNEAKITNTDIIVIDLCEVNIDPHNPNKLRATMSEILSKIAAPESVLFELYLSRFLKKKNFAMSPPLAGIKRFNASPTNVTRRQFANEILI